MRNPRTCEFSRSMVGSAGTSQPAARRSLTHSLSGLPACLPPRACRCPAHARKNDDACGRTPAATPRPRQQPLGRARACAGGGPWFSRGEGCMSAFGRLINDGQAAARTRWAQNLQKSVTCSRLASTLLKYVGSVRNEDPRPYPAPGLRSVGGPKLLKWGLSGRGSNLLKF